MGNKVLTSMKHLNVTGDRKLIPHFIGPFSIVQQVRPLACQLNLGNRYIQVHLIFHISLFKPFMWEVMCMGSQQLCISIMSKSRESERYLDIKDQVEKGSIQLNN